jgi:hypothetical protein
MQAVQNKEGTLVIDHVGLDLDIDLDVLSDNLG